jgi:NADPH2:quinone reductase
MKAAFIRKVGPAEGIELGELPEPSPGSGEVLVEVGAVSINPIDTYIRAGLVPVAAPFPLVLGSDFAGRVLAVGEGVRRFRAGDRVWGANQGIAGRQGTFAERIAVSEEWCHPIPDGVDEETAAAGAVTGLTAWLGLFARAGLRSGETVMVQGGSGGVGSMVVQIAAASGARVLASAGSPEKLERCRALGAEVAISYREPGFGDRILAAAPGGVDLWWESRRAPDFDLVAGCLAMFGRMVLMAGRDARPEFPVGRIYTKAASVIGHVLFAFLPEQQRDAAHGLHRLLAEGKLRPPIDRVIPLEEVAEGHRVQWRSTVEESGELSGKIVVRIGGAR